MSPESPHSPSPFKTTGSDSTLPSPEICRLTVILGSTVCLLVTVVAWLFLSKILYTQGGVQVSEALAVLAALGTLPVLGLLVRAVATKPLSLRMARLHHALVVCAFETALLLVTGVCHFLLNI